VIIGDKIETETKTLQQKRNACDISVAVIDCSLQYNDRNRNMKNYWIWVILIGVIIAVGSPIVDLILAFNGIFIPNMLGWVTAMMGVCIVALGAVCAIDSRGW